MRITEKQSHSVVDLVCKLIDRNAKVWLFGSRCDDFKKGGDIDLYIESETIDSPLLKRIKLKIALEDVFGEQKVDVVYHDTNLPYQPIHEIAKAEGIVLN
jgi:predicted nucleotidyltransferase